MKNIVEYYRNLFELQNKHPGITKRALNDWKQRELTKTIFYLSGKAIQNNFLTKDMLVLETIIEEYNKVIDDKYNEED